MAIESIKILVVDDFATMRKIIKNLLGQLGYKNVHEADDGSTALVMLEKERFDLIIADWNMPQMSGLNLLKTTRDNENYKNTPFVMVTAEANKNNIVAAIQAGATDYIIKPFNANTLQEKIKKIFGQ